MTPACRKCVADVMFPIPGRWWRLVQFRDDLSQLIAFCGHQDLKNA